MKAQNPRQKALVSWNSKQKDVVDRYVSYLSQILNIGQNGEVSTSEIAKLEIFLKILAQNINIAGISDLETKRNLIFQAAFLRFGKYETKNISTFSEALTAETDQHLNRPFKKFWILLPLNVYPGAKFDRFRSFSILSKRLLIRNWNYIEKHFDYTTFMTDVNRKLPIFKIPLHSYFVPILVAVDAQDDQKAFDEANRSFDLFRSLLNLQFTFGMSSLQFGGYPRPLAKILPPPIYGVFDGTRKYLQFYYNIVNNYEYTQNDIADDKIIRCRKLASTLKSTKSEDDIMSLNVEVLEKYGEALDTSEWRLSFLILWQILESITLQSNEEFSMKTVVNRINILFGQNQLNKDLLSALYQTRNLLVHKGYFPSEQGLREVNLLKSIVEPSMQSILAQAKYLPTKNSLNKFYEHATDNNADLNERARIISLIRQHRAKHKN